MCNTRCKLCAIHIVNPTQAGYLNHLLASSCCLGFDHSKIGTINHSTRDKLGQSKRDNLTKDLINRHSKGKIKLDHLKEENQTTKFKSQNAEQFGFRTESKMLTNVKVSSLASLQRRLSESQQIKRKEKDKQCSFN